MSGELKFKFNQSSHIFGSHFFYRSLNLIVLCMGAQAFAGAHPNSVAHFSPPDDDQTVFTQRPNQLPPQALLPAEPPAYDPRTRPANFLEPAEPATMLERPPAYTPRITLPGVLALPPQAPVQGHAIATQPAQVDNNTLSLPELAPRHRLPQSSDALYTMAVNYFEGKNGFPKNPFQAISLFELASVKNNYRAQPFLGWLYLKGRSVANNCRKAQSLFYKSALRKNPSGYYHLGLLAENGCSEGGSPIFQPNFNEALHFYAHAANPKNRPADQSPANAEVDNITHQTAIKTLQRLKLQFEPSLADFGFHEDVHLDERLFEENLRDPTYFANLYASGTTQEGGLVVRDLPMAIHFFAHGVDQEVEGAMAHLLRLKQEINPNFNSTDYDYHEDLDCFKKARFTAALLTSTIPEQFTNDVCTTCHDEFTNYEGALTVLPCGHVYHARCHSQWANGADGLDGIQDGHTPPHTSCPQCRANLPDY